MPRRARQLSRLRLYHVMVRGINRSPIFHDEIDCQKMIKTLQMVSRSTEHQGQVQPESCAIHAYCLMTNHMHLLVEERNDKLQQAMKRIGVTYASYYNKRYGRVGPVFQGRFRSEPVNDVDYFVSLINYIHLNPVRAALADLPSDYKWSSANDYTLRTLDITHAMSDFKIPFDGLTVEKLMQLLQRNMEVRGFVPVVDDRSAAERVEARVTGLLPDGCGLSQIKGLPRDLRDNVLKQASQLGVSMRQLARMTGISISTIYRLLRP